MLFFNQLCFARLCHYFTFVIFTFPLIDYMSNSLLIFSFLVWSILLQTNVSLKSHFGCLGSATAEPVCVRLCTLQSLLCTRFWPAYNYGKTDITLNQIMAFLTPSCWEFSVPYPCEILSHGELHNVLSHEYYSNDSCKNKGKRCCHDN